MTDAFDYIVVGAGSAGCVLAARLSEDPATSVLLLESGPPDRSPWIHLPIGYGKTMWSPTYNWCFETEPEPQMNGRRVYWPRGKTLGGSSSINGLIYIRGQREDYDHWATLGNVGWGYDDVLPYFIRSEHNQRGADAFHGGDGPLKVSDIGSRHELIEAFIAELNQAAALLLLTGDVDTAQTLAASAIAETRALHSHASRGTDRPANTP